MQINCALAGVGKGGWRHHKKMNFLKTEKTIDSSELYLSMEFLVNRPFKNSWRYGIWAWVNENIVSLMESLLSVEKLWKKAQSKRQIIIKIDSEAQHLYKTQSPPSSDNPVFTLIALTKDKQLPGSPQYLLTNQPTQHSTIFNFNFIDGPPGWCLAPCSPETKSVISQVIWCWSKVVATWQMKVPLSSFLMSVTSRLKEPEPWTGAYHAVSVTSKNIFNATLWRESAEQWTFWEETPEQQFSQVDPKSNWWRQEIEKLCAELVGLFGW